MLGQGTGYAAIDAPFSIPQAYAPDIAALWRMVGRLPLENRPFPKGEAFLRVLDPLLGPKGEKIYRETEKHWQLMRVNTCSTLWNGPRGGIPFAVACMTLLGRHSGDIWLMRMKEANPGFALVEAFPAAQLRHWHLPHEKYDGLGEDARRVRRTARRQTR